MPRTSGHGRALVRDGGDRRVVARWWKPLALAAVLAGCSEPSPVAPILSAGLALEGRTVTWTTTEPVLGAVRWGEHAGRYDHVSYPAGSEERAALTRHHVPLLAAAAGESVYVQTLARVPGGALTAGSEHGFRLAADAPAAGAQLEWTMVDVGFGDAHVLTMPGTGERVLVDAGERRDAPNVERWLTDAGVSRLDAVVMTHAHEDHIGGLVGTSADPADGVLGDHEVGELVEGPPPSAHRVAYDELVALCAARGIPRETVHDGATSATDAALAWDPRVTVRVLHAGDGRAAGGATESDWLNDDSIVMRLTYGEVSVVLGGDAEAVIEQKLVGSGAALEASALKVHHHGVADDTQPSYVAAVHPRVGLIPITAYESTSGTLPSGTALERLRAADVDVYASDRAEPLGLRLQGDTGIHVTLRTDGASIEIAVTPSASVHWPGDGWSLARHAAGGDAP